MKLTDNDKLIIGVLLKNLRIANNLNQKEVYDGCCSNVTLSKIENGGTIKSDEVYDDLLAKFGEKWNYDSLDIEVLLHEFYCACELYDENLIIDTFNNLKKVLKVKLDYLYEREIIEVVQLVVDYYINDKNIDYDCCLKYRDIYSIFPIELQILIADVCFAYLSSHYSINYVYDYMQSFDVLAYNSIITKINAIKFYVWDERPLKAFQLLLCERDNLEKTNTNLNRLTQIYMLNIILMNNYQQKDLEVSMSKFEEYLNGNNTSKKFKIKGRLQLANIYYKNEIYKKAYESYKQVVEYKPSLYSLILLNFMSTLLENTSLIYTPNVFDLDERHDLMVLYKYYILKNNILNKQIGDMQDLINFAYVNFHNLVVDEFYEEILTKELEWLSTTTKNYNIRRITVNKEKKK